jgi:1,4-alpha-glucan branching enzyme
MRRLVQMAARELLLLQASDWPFLINNGTAVDYSSKRIAHHYTDYKRVAALARRYGRGEHLSDADWAWFGDLQSRDRPFADMDPTCFGPVKHPAGAG